MEDRNVRTDVLNNPDDEKRTRSLFSVWKIFLPVIIGIGVVILMFIHDAESENLIEILKDIRFSPRAVACIVIGLIFMVGRDFGLSWRFRILTDNQLKWKQAIKVDLLCEFTSCITPSAVGGSSFGMIYLNSQGIELGRATTLMMTTLFFDELFLVVACPVVVLLTPAGDLFTSSSNFFTYGLEFTFWVIYGVLVLWTTILFIGIVLYPSWMKKVLVNVCKLKFLRRFSSKAASLGDNMIETSGKLRNKSIGFWVKGFFATSVSWLSRYAVVNALFWGFVPSADPYQGLILAREFVIWVVLMVSPTPGGAGLSEWLFSEYYSDLVAVGGMALVLAVFWRIISYYVYLIIGACIVPGWLRDYYHKTRTATRETK
ncbi:MAG: flippase-like domain-containing protein [Bacteroidales bacterium]|nr:flippase-like domain-containing protein [Bacteroidales bacterium]